MQHLPFLSVLCSTTTTPHEATFMLLSFEFKEVQTLPEPAAVMKEKGHVLWGRQKKVKDLISRPI
jgi:hypothetical protein